ncbi:hypothetical protein ACHAXR_011687 [Thalassiosira sp. AJA248-18]
MLWTLLAICAIASCPTLSEGKKQQKTHYDVLELQQDASLKDIKKAYRRLAVQHHPDRNLGNEDEATVKFREISEAYEVLSDEGSRREYDRALKGGFGHGDGDDRFKWSYNGDGNNGSGGGRQQHPRHRRHRDPFAQFNDVFQNDPFFAEAFKSMDDLFDQHFSNNNFDRNRGGSSSTQQRREKRGADDKMTKNQDGSGGGSWVWNKVKDYMPNINIEVKTSSSSSSGGSTSYSSTSRSYGGSSTSSSSSRRRSSTTSSNRNSRGSSSSYTSKSTRTVIQNGQRITIQSLEKDGNKIEEKYIGEKLIERKINGMKEDIGKIGRGREEF